MPASTPAVTPARSDTTENVLALIHALEDPGAIDAGLARHVSAQLRAYLCETVPDAE